MRGSLPPPRENPQGFAIVLGFFKIFPTPLTPGTCLPQTIPYLMC